MTTRLPFTFTNSSRLEPSVASREGGPLSTSRYTYLLSANSYLLFSTLPACPLPLSTNNPTISGRASFS